MNLLPTFGFKGNILPVIDRNDKFYIIIKNECDYKVLLNFVSLDINKFINIEKNSTKFIQCGVFKEDLHIKIFYMGQELFDYQSIEINKSSLLLYSDYIMKNNLSIDSVYIDTSFLEGCKIITTSNKPQQLFVKIVDKDTNKIIHEDNFVTGEPYTFHKDYYINYEISILNYKGDEIYNTSLDLKDKIVWIKIDDRGLGNTLAWIPYIDEFRKKHGCKVLCTTYWNHLFISKYTDIKFVLPTSIIEEKTLFAVYKIQLNIPSKHTEIKKDYRELSLQQISSTSLGLDDLEIKPFVSSTLLNRTINEDYVVISTTASFKAKLWNNKDGWEEIIDYLTKKGLKIVLLQKEKEEKFKNIINLSGTDDVYKSIEILKYCKFFIGLSSDLSWLAWSLEKKVLMISGCTEPMVEFSKNNYRITNKLVCNGCWNDKEYEFDKKDWSWCPRNKNFECSTSVSTQMVLNKITEIFNDLTI